MHKNRQTLLGVVCIGAALILMVLWIMSRVLLEFYVDVLWFRSERYAHVFWTIFSARAALGLAASAFVFACLYANVYWAWRHSRALLRPYSIGMLDPRRIDKAIHALVLAGVLFLSCLFGLSVSRNWRTVLEWFYRVPFEVRDPIFDHDVGFYVFQLPLIAYTIQTLLFLLALCMGVSLLVYFLRGAVDFSTPGPVLSREVRKHLGVLGAAVGVLVAGQCWMARYHVLLSKRGAVFGAGYADVHAQVGAYTLLSIGALAAGVWLAYCAFKRRRGTLVALAAYGVAWLALSAGYPAAVQAFLVKPNEFAKEEPYLEHNIAFTRKAYGLDAIEECLWPGDAPIGRAELAAHPGTVDNLLLWDPVPLTRLFNQKQRIRLYYNFDEIDADRYRIDGKLRPVMLAARELDPDLLPEKSRVWTNLHIEYTHGYGLCLSLANRIAPGGMPEFAVDNIPPEARPGLEVTQPRVYFGEQTDRYALVGTRLDEFDYPGDPQNFYSRYDGRGGIPAGGLLRRALLSWYTGHKEILFTDQFTADSRMLLFRNIRERAMRIAPFLYFDEDPYPVLLNGRILWVLDAYTLTRRFPYSETVGIANYWRNAVKVTVDAYDGTVTFYRFDEKDPLLKVIERIFPGMMRAAAEMPAGLVQHLRYPQDLFRVQTALYCRYHMNGAREFFTNEDAWTFPKDSSDARQPFEPPRYLVAELPKTGPAASAPQPPEEFVLARTFTVEGKDNMIAWMAAGCDPGRYGKLIVYRLPKDRNIYGPTQAKGRFNQDPEVSSFMTLMGQLGSAILTSPVLAVPIEQGILYVQSFYIEDPQVKIPELKQVVIGQGDRVAMAPTVEQALDKLFGARLTAAPALAGEQTPANSIARARELYEQARENLKQGDWAAFGKAFDEIGQLLEENRP